MSGDSECRHGLLPVTCSICQQASRVSEGPIKGRRPRDVAKSSPISDVWVSGSGQCYHADRECPAFRSGQELAARRGRHFSVPEAEQLSLGSAMETLVPCSRCIDFSKGFRHMTRKGLRPTQASDNFCLKCLRGLRLKALECPTCGNASVYAVQLYETP